MKKLSRGCRRILYTDRTTADLVKEKTPEHLAKWHFVYILIRLGLEVYEKDPSAGDALVASESPEDLADLGVAV